MIGVYAGSFDPFTNGHLEIVRQAGDVFDQVIVLVAENPDKRHWLSGPERKAIIEGSVAGDVEVDILPGGEMAVEYAFRLGACLIRGLGEFTDYPAEKALSGINDRLRPEVKTVFLMSREADNQMRSSAVREALKYRFGWRSIRDVVPQPTLNAALLKLLAAKAEAAGLPSLPGRPSLARYLDRPYHNLEHLIYMLDLAELWNPGGQSAAPADLLAAVLYHDLFVDSDLDVEAGQDVAWSVQAVEAMDLPGCSPERVLEMIRATDHRLYTFAPGPKPELTPGQALMCRLDLAVLGESHSEYSRYAEAIGREYGLKYGYLSKTFRSGRAGFLRVVLQRLAAGPIVNAEYDQQMALNMRWELDDLAKTIPGLI